MNDDLQYLSREIGRRADQLRFSISRLHRIADGLDAHARPWLARDLRKKSDLLQSVMLGLNRLAERVEISKPRPGRARLLPGRGKEGNPS